MLQDKGDARFPIALPIHSAPSGREATRLVSERGIPSLRHANRSHTLDERPRDPLSTGRRVTWNVAG